MRSSLRSQEAAETKVNPADTDDIRMSLQGDGDAYARLMERYQDTVASRMWRFSREAREPRELVQEVFVEAFLSLSSYRGAAPFEHWLAKIATFVGYRFWKNRERTRANEAVPIEEWHLTTSGSPDSMEPTHAADLLHGLLDRLPPRDRLVLMLRYVEDRSVEETAALAGWTVSMVKVQTWRARRKLKRLSEEAGLEVVS